MKRFNQICCWGVLTTMLIASFGCQTVTGTGHGVLSAGQHIEQAAD